MKKILFLSLLPFSFFFASCEIEHILELESPNSVTILDNGEAQELTFSSNQPWAIESSDSWCHVYPSSGDGSDGSITVSINCDENTSYEVRSTTLTLRAGNLVETVSISQNPKQPSSLYINLKDDTGRDEVMYLLNDGSYFVYESRAEGSIESVYFNNDLGNDLSQGVLLKKNNSDGTMSLSHKGSIIIFNKVEDSTYNLAFQEKEGATYFWYGVTIDEQELNISNIVASNIYTKATDWHLVKWTGYKLLSFLGTALGVVSFPPIGVPALILTIHTEYLRSYGNINDDLEKEYIYGVENINTLNGLLTGWVDWMKLMEEGVLQGSPSGGIGAFLTIFNTFADDEFEKIGHVKEEVIPELGLEWLFRLERNRLICLNNDTQYTIPVQSKALWRVNDEGVDKSWCSVEKSGDNLLVTIKTNPNPGYHTCYAMVEQAVESNIYYKKINPARLDIEMQDASFSVSPTELVFDSGGGTKEVSVKISDSMIGWFIDKDRSPDWCSYEPLDKSFIVTVGPSNSGHEAESIIVCGALDETTFFDASITVRQEKSQIEDPDETLRKKLIQFYIDTGGDEWYRNDNWCSEKPIEEWFGISKNKKNGLWNIYLFDNNLTGSGSLSGFKDLERIECERNPMQSLDLSDCTALKWVVCCEGSLNSLNVSNCTSLISVNCHTNRLESLIVSGCTSLCTISCIDNKLKSLDVSSCAALEWLLCQRNELESIDVTKCPVIERLECENNHIVQQITIEDSIPLFTYDCLYYNYRIQFYDDNGQPHYQWDQHEYGWYFEGEPQKGYHGR